MDNYIVAIRKIDNKLMFFKAWGLIHYLVLVAQALSKGKAYLIIAGIDGIVSFSQFIEKSAAEYGYCKNHTDNNCKKKFPSFNINTRRKGNYFFKRIGNTHTNRVKHCKGYKAANG